MYSVRNMFLASASHLAIQRNSSPKNENSLIIYSSSCHPRCLWLSFFRWTQEKIFSLYNARGQDHFYLFLFYCDYLSHTRLYREYITSSEMYSLHLTHPKWTHTRSSGQPCYSARGAVGGSVPCSRTPQSWYWRRRERWLFTPPPTIPAGPEIWTHNLWITSPTL